jgi:hypothetical protein
VRGQEVQKCCNRWLDKGRIVRANRSFKDVYDKKSAAIEESRAAEKLLGGA